MRLKSFYAKTMTEAMQIVRDTLGEEAIIVATREEQGGKSVRVTAAVEPAFEVAPSSDPAEAEDWLQYDDEDEEFAVAEEITEAMLRHSVPENVMDQIISCATVIGLEQPGIALIAAIEHLFHFRPLPTSTHKKPIMMVGPPGSGKTLATAKMAARAVMNGLKVGVITTDTVRAGGIEQLSAFTKLLRIDLQKAETPKDLVQAIEKLTDCDQILIDSRGTNPFNAEDVKTTAKLISADNIEPYLVLPAGGDAEEAGEIARAFAALGAHSLISTRLDIARRLGSLLSAAHHGNMAFSDVSTTPKVADGLYSLTPKTLAKLLMPTAYREQKPARKTGT